MLSSGRDREIDAIDLRRSAGGTDLDPHAGMRRFYLAVLLLATVVALGAFFLDLARSVVPADLPVLDSYYSAGDGDTPAGWRILEIMPDATGLRAGDLAVAVDGISLRDLVRSDSLRRTLDRKLKHGSRLVLDIQREPNFRTRSFYRWSFLGVGGNGGGPYVRSVVLDSTRATSGLEATVRALDPTDPDVCDGGGSTCPEGTQWLGRIPDSLDLAGAEAALVAYDPALRTLPAETEVRLGIRGDDLARPVLAVKPPSGTAVQIEAGPMGWVTIPAGTAKGELALVRRPWTRSVASLASRLAVLLVLTVGLLALRARTRSPAVLHFAAVCALLSTVAALAARQTWGSWFHPLSPHLAFGDQYFAYQARDGAWSHATVVLPSHFALVGLGGLALCLVLYSALRLLHTFPSADPTLEERYRMPWRAVPAAAVLAAGSSALLLFAARERSARLWLLAGVLFLAGTYLLVLVAMLVQVARLAVARRRKAHTGEEAVQARLALSGLALGAVVLLVIVLTPTGYRASRPWTVHVYDVMVDAKRVATPIALTVPFLGFFLAIAKRGLWNVDVIIQRARLLSSLTALFVLVWLVLEASVESFLSNSLGRVPVLGGLAPALLAAGVVAVSRHSITGLLSRRRKGAHRPFGEVVDVLHDELDRVHDPADLPGRLVRRLRELARPEPCALLLRQDGGCSWNAWRSDLRYPASAIVASSLDTLKSARHVVVVVEEGPCLVTRVEQGGQLTGVLLTGLRPGGAFYTAQERRVLALLVSGVAHRIGSHQAREPVDGRP